MSTAGADRTGTSRVTQRADDVEVAIDLAHGGRIASLVVDGCELMLTEPAPGTSGVEAAVSWGAFVMAPFAGRIRHGRFSWRGDEHELPANFEGHAIHGTVFDAAWTVVDDQTFRCELGPGWPYGGHVEHRVELTGEALTMRLELHAAVPMPVTMGWHPWFRRHLDRGEPAVIELEAQSMYVLDDEGIPDGTTTSPTPGPWDDCFTDVLRPPRVRWPGALELELSSSCVHWVAFDRRERAVCLEPQTDRPDAHNGEVAVVEPGTPLVATTTWRWFRPV